MRSRYTQAIPETINSETQCELIVEQQEVKHFDFECQAKFETPKKKKEKWEEELRRRAEELAQVKTYQDQLCQADIKVQGVDQVIQWEHGAFTKEVEL